MTAKIHKILASGWAEDPVVTDDHWREIEEGVGLNFLPAQRNRIISAISAYIGDISLYRQSPRASTVRPLLDEIATKAGELVGALGKLSSGAAARGARQLLAREAMQSRSEHHRLTEIKATIRQLAGDAAAAGEACREDIGAPGDPYLDTLIDRLHRVYRDAGGTGLYTKSSRQFLMLTCRLAGARIHSSAALDQRLKRAFGQKSGD